MGKTREGDGGSPYTKPPKPHPGPFVPAPKKDIFHAKTTQPGNSVNDLT
jgi:hypothetical protein